MCASPERSITRTSLRIKLLLAMPLTFDVMSRLIGRTKTREEVLGICIQNLESVFQY